MKFLLPEMVTFALIKKTLSTVLAIAWNFICMFENSLGVVSRKQQVWFLLCFVSRAIL